MVGWVPVPPDVHDPDTAAIDALNDLREAMGVTAEP